MNPRVCYVSMRMRSLEGNKILVVDDEEDIRLILREILEIEGAHVVEASNGSQAWEHLRRDPSVELLLTDIVMPGGSGDELLRRVRTNSDLPVVVVTGFSSIHRDSLIADGADAVLAKPFDMSDLLVTLRQCLRTDRDLTV